METYEPYETSEDREKELSDARQIWYEAPDVEYYEDSHIAKFEIYGHENCEECVWNAESKTRILP